MKILILGKNGQLGKSMKKALATKNSNDEYIYTSRSDIDMLDSESISNFFDGHKIDIIVNCSAYTNVDKAENEEFIANQVNHLAVEKLAVIASLKNIRLIHISTDHVYDGKKQEPYSEKDYTCPLNIYGKTKLKGEMAILRILPSNGIIIRTSWLYSEYRQNFVKTILKKSQENSQLKIVTDQISNPTYSYDLAKVIINMIETDIFKKINNETQIFHFSNEGSCSWYEFSKKIFEFAEVECNINPIKTIDYNRVANVPKNTSLNKDKVKEILNLKIPEWEDSLYECIQAINHHHL
jgi:dTDP-4-dehydrorhamnose reductase